MSLTFKLKIIKCFPGLLRVVFMALAVIISYGLGYLNSYTDLSGELFYVEAVQISAIPQEILENNTKKTIVASKNGTKYYYIWCSGVGRIKEENKVYFSTIEEALKRGLEPAANCQGL